MRTWPALLLAPLLALADQSVAYMLAGWTCAHGHETVGHAVHAIFLVAILATTALAWTTARTGFDATREAAGFSVNRHDSMALCALALGVLSAMIVVAMWIPQWMLSPCYG
jgi:hypothetical protein